MKKLNLFTKFVVLVVLVWATSFVACTNSVVDDESPAEGSVPISFKGKVSRLTATRVLDTALEPGDRIGLMAMLSGTPINGMRYINNVLLTASDGGVLTPEKTIYYPDDDRAKLDFIAYHPYRVEGIPNASSEVEVAVSSDQRNKENWDNSDFLVASKLKVGATTNSVTLTFKHKLVKVKVELQPISTGVLDALLESDPQITACGFHTQSTYNFATEQFSNPVNPEVIHLAGTWKKSAGKLIGKEMIVVPQSLTEGNQYLILELNGKVYTCPLQAAELNSNSQRVINIRVKESLEPVLSSVLSEVQDWGDGVVTESQSEADYQSASVLTSTLSFRKSNIYHAYYEGRILAEISKEYLRLPEANIDAPALVLYEAKDGVVDDTHGKVLELLGETGSVHGGQLVWDKATNTAQYTPGNSAPIRTLYFDNAGSVVFEKPVSPCMVRLKNYLLRDIRSTEENFYGVVKIGTQYWMQENLRATRYANGKTLYQQTEIGKGAGFFKPSEVAHVFYNAEALLEGDLAPLGWRIPKVSDWDALVKYVGEVAALKNGEWTSLTGKPVVSVTNRSYFNATPTGMWVEKYMSGNSVVAYWSLNEDGTNVVDKSIFLIGDFADYSLQNTYYQKMNAYKAISIRCLRK